MGNTESSLPLALEERNHTYRSHGHINQDLYNFHCSSDTSNGLPPDQTSLPPDLTTLPPALTCFPPALTQTVSLYQNLDLSFNLIKEIPMDLPLRLPHLRHINLSHNQLEILPQSVFGFLHLEHLDLSHNLLSYLPSSLRLLTRLSWLDVSHNKLSQLPPTFGDISSIQKLNLSDNSLDHLPISLGALPRLVVLLVHNNHLGEKLVGLYSQTDCRGIIKHLQAEYRRTQSELADRTFINQFARERGSVFDSRVLNAGSAQSLFAQLQAQAVQTGNRLLTPMIPPVGATTLDVDRLRDAITGMFYGSIVGDSLGVLTQFMTPVEAKFYYSGASLDLASMHVDSVRCRYSPGDVTLGSHLVLTLLESVLAWGGVVDELDYVERLCLLLQGNTQLKYDSSVLKGLASNLEEFRSNPVFAADQWLRQHPSPSSHPLVVDNMCLPPVAALVMSSFHSLAEVNENAARICSASHPHPSNTAAAQCLANLLTKLLQGKSTQDALEEAKSTLSSQNLSPEQHADISHPWVCLSAMLHGVEMFLSAGEDGFRSAMSATVMKGGHATVTGCVTGAVLGILTGFQNVPKDWIENVNVTVRRNMDKKLNNLFDLMGVP